MKRIKLTQGKFALVDDADYEMLNKWKWCAIKSGKNFYAQRYHSIIMHREILQTPKGLETDHIDGNGLNNQRSNLRIATHSQNGKNRGKCNNNTSGFKGVSWNKKNKRWQANIKINGKRKYLGEFTSKELAHIAYCEACTKYHGEFANLN